MLRFRGSEHFRQRLVCATLAGRAIRIDDIRSQDQNPGLRDYEASLLRLLEKVTNGCIIEINETGEGRRGGAAGLPGGGRGRGGGRTLLPPLRGEPAGSTDPLASAESPQCGAAEGDLSSQNGMAPPLQLASWPAGWLAALSGTALCWVSRRRALACASQLCARRRHQPALQAGVHLWRRGAGARLRHQPRHWLLP